ncbi:hypothetical protein EVAR_6469_1 [Eumeta japonica]|uniref:Uncharacterized protein n=1 Tax=Eumeta variegata TaxID=151549 RepID=A0A4C1SQG3_EUMVA|nr:hypothetical protein EVAR_6469_1 [Eumeta japonica]
MNFARAPLWLFSAHLDKPIQSVAALFWGNSNKSMFLLEFGDGRCGLKTAELALVNTGGAARCGRAALHRRDPTSRTPALALLL